MAVNQPSLDSPQFIGPFRAALDFWEHPKFDAISWHNRLDYADNIMVNDPSYTIETLADIESLLSPPPDVHAGTQHSLKFCGIQCQGALMLHRCAYMPFW